MYVLGGEQKIIGYKINVDNSNRLKGCDLL